MSTHILSDVEALCDEVAILRGGKLAATGKLHDLLASDGEAISFEVTATGLSAEALGNIVGRVTEKASGLSIEVNSEKEIDAAIQSIRAAGGKLLSVQPIKQSLEELFVEKTTKQF